MEKTQSFWSLINLQFIANSRPGGVFSVELIDDRDGLIVFKATGDDELFKNEAGGHRIQRVPPTEKRGRTHTSTITIAVLPEITERQISIKENELIWKTCRGSGPGGQHRNKTESAVQVTHIPTGLNVRCESGRSQHHNKISALEILRARLWELGRKEVITQRANDRKEQVGSGMRGDKRRTVRFQDGQVVDHITGRRWNLKNYLRGEW